MIMVFENIKYSYQFNIDRSLSDQLIKEFYRRTGREQEWIGSDVFDYY